MKKDVASNQNISFEDYENKIYDRTMINSIIFDPELQENLDKDIILNNDKMSEFYYGIVNWMKQNEGCHFFDQLIKDNLYFFANVVLERNSEISHSEKIEKLNYVKLYINQCKEFKTDFIYDQMAVRLFGRKYCNPSLKLFNSYANSDEQILEYRDDIYEAISCDLEFLDCFYIADENFYNEEYKDFLLSDSFNMSLNYFLQFCPRLFLKDENFNRVKYIINESFKMLENGKVEETMEIGSKKLLYVSQKMVNKFEKRRNRTFN